MSSNYGKSQSGSMNSFDFDLGINSNRSKPLNAQKNNNNNNTYTQPKPNTTTPYWQSNKPSWTHQPAAPTQSSTLGGSLNGPTSMVGDITGRSWAASAPQRNSNTAGGNIGIGGKNPNLFSDLLGSNLGVGKGSVGNVPLKNVASVSSGTASKSAYSMGGMADSLPKFGNTGNSGGVGGSGGGGWGSSQGFGNYNTSGYGSKSQNLGGPSMKSSSVSGGGVGVGGGMNSNKDPFGSLVDFSSKPAAGMKAGSKSTAPKASGDDVFGTFQNASKPSASSFSSNSTSFTGSGIGSQAKLDDFGFGQPPVQSSGMGSQSKMDNFGFGQPPVQSSGIGSQSKMDDFGFGGMQSQPPVQSSGGNDFDMLFSSSSASGGNASKASEAFANQQFAGAEDWGFESDIGGGGGDVGGTTELEGLPPPPAGVTSSSAKSKGMDNYKAGQYPDAIKWLSWAVILLEKAGDNAGTTEVLSSRASCYKEVGEYKKAVADCSKVLEQDGKNVSVLVQRALLYESMEKYKLGAEDLRTVMNIDPGNRVARSTIHRLNKLAG
ncbi:putative tetratricopeptide-like helical domain superfamily [Helianthus annuus]|nr:putative tetratricopeptide-like helical domain superfamily [Helianthus annuus]